MGLLFVSAFGLGIAFCAPPGAVTAEALRRGIARGFWPALLIELGSLVGDATWAAVALVGAAFLVQNTPARLILGAAGALFLLRLAWSALKDAWAGRAPQARTTAPQGDFAAGAMLSLGNPYAVAFWLGVGGAMVAAGVANPEPAHFVVFFAGFMLAALLWCFFMSVLITWGRRFVGSTLFRWINLACGLALGYLGLTLLWSMLQLMLI